MEKLRGQIPGIKISRREALRLTAAVGGGVILIELGLGAKNAIEESNLGLWLALWQGGAGDEVSTATRNDSQAQETLPSKETLEAVATELFTSYQEGVKTAARQPIYELVHNKKGGEVKKLATVAVLLTKVGSSSSYQHQKVLYLLAEAEKLVGYPSFRPGGELAPMTSGLTVETAAGIYRRLVQKIAGPIDPLKLIYLLPFLVRTSEHLVCGELPTVCQRPISVVPTPEKLQPSPTPTKVK